LEGPREDALGDLGCVDGQVEGVDGLGRRRCGRGRARRAGLRGRGAFGAGGQACR